MFFKKKKQSESEQLDPNSLASLLGGLWMSPVDLAGEFLDLSAYWRRTRRWGAVCAILPVALVFVVLGVFIAIGKWGSDGAKVEWYAERAFTELSKVEPPKTEPAKEGDESPEKPEADPSTKRLPELIDMLYRRVLQLNQNNKLAKFYVAQQMARYGSKSSARQIMESIAPIQTSGYSKAHGWLAMDLLERAQKGEAINIETLEYHLKQGTSGEKRGSSGEEVPPALLFAYSQLLQQKNKPAESQEYLKRAAQFDPKLLLNSIQTYNQNGNPSQAANAADMLVERLKDKSENQEENIVLAAQAYALTDRVDRALEVLQAALRRFPQSKLIARAASDAFRLKFRSSSTQANGQVQVNLEYLNAAIAIDPTNTDIQNELSALSQLGIGQNDATIEALRVQIATSGTSFAARLLLAESSFRRGNIGGAINDYEVILAELPTMTLALNSLAMLYTQAVPPRLDEGLQLIDRAISIAPAVAGLYDSRGDILIALKKKEDAIQSFLLSLEKAPLRVETREKLIGLYEELSQSEQAQTQRDKLVEVQKAIELQRTRMKEAQEQAKQRMEATAPAPTANPPMLEEDTKANQEPASPEPAAAPKPTSDQ